MDQDAHCRVDVRMEGNVMLRLENASVFHHGMVRRRKWKERDGKEMVRLKEKTAPLNAMIRLRPMGIHAIYHVIVRVRRTIRYNEGGESTVVIDSSISDHGSCRQKTGKCVCKPGWEGEKCEKGKGKLRPPSETAPISVCDDGKFGFECRETCGNCTNADGEGREREGKGEEYSLRFTLSL